MPMLIDDSPKLTLTANAPTEAPPVLPAPSCALCDSGRLHYAFSDGEARVLRCADCGLLRVDPRTSRATDPLDEIEAPVQILGVIRQALNLLSRYRDGMAGRPSSSPLARAHRSGNRRRWGPE